MQILIPLPSDKSLYYLVSLLQEALGVMLYLLRIHKKN